MKERETEVVYETINCNRNSDNDIDYYYYDNYFPCSYFAIFIMNKVHCHSSVATTIGLIVVIFVFISILY